MSAEQTLESLVELLEKFNYKNDEDSDSYSFFEAKLNEDWFFHLVEEAKRGVVEIAKLREQLAAAESRLEFRDKTGSPFCDSCAAWEQMAWEMKQRAEAAEAKLKAESEQEPVCLYQDNIHNLHWYVDVPDGITKLYAAPVPPADAQELQKKYDRLDAIASTSADLNNRQAERIAELERKLAEHQALNDDVFGIARSSGAEELNTLLAQAREEGRKDAVPDGWQVVPKEPTEEVLQAVRDGISLAKRISADEAAIAYGVMLTSAPKLEVKP